MKDIFKVEGNMLVKYYDNLKITRITIPNYVTKIGDNAFSYCNSLISVTIPDSVKSIGNYAFCNCKSLTSIVIPSSVTSIGNWVFFGCSNLTKIVIPDGVTNIENEAFSYCSNLTSIVIPNGVTSIGECAFYGCSDLTKIIIPDGVMSIGNYAFQDCKSLISKKAHYKAFNITEQGIMCKDYVFKPGKWTKNIRNPEFCKKGYHFCDNLFNIFNYYSGKIDKDIAIYECEVGKIVFSDENNEKYVTNKIKPVKKLDRKNIISILNNIQKEENYVYNESKS